MKARLLALLAAGACAFAPAAPPPGAAPRALRCEYLVEPLGVDEARPRLSWVVGDRARGAVQTAYQILAATTPARLRPGAADLWDSGRQNGEGSLHVEWGGAPLSPTLRVHWTVRTWDAADRPSAFAAPTWFETGLARDGDWAAQWIGGGEPPPGRAEDWYADRPAPLLRRAFRLDGTVRRARLYLAGLGYHVAWLNGARVGDHRLDPPWTAFDRVVPYAVHDVTALLRQGDNALAVLLGNGWYAPLPLRLWGRLDLREVLPVGAPKLLCRLVVEFDDGRRVVVGSDGQWRTAPSHVRRNNVYLGERHDARREPRGFAQPTFDDAAWAPAAVATAPGGALRWLPLPPVRATRTLAPRAIRTVRPGLHVVDFGQNFAGVVRLRPYAPAGTEIVLRFAEELHADGTLDVDSTVAAQVKQPGIGGPGAPDVAWQEDRYVCRGDGDEVFEPHFTWHGGRYVEITGLPYAPALRDVEGVVLHTDLRPAASFACADVLLDRVHELVDWTLRSNAMSVLSDCPARERFGYGGDMVAAADAWLAHFDVAPMLAKTVGDFARAARPHGGLPECAPDTGVNEGGLTADSGPLGWMFAHPWLLQQAYRHYGDRRLVAEQYDTLARLVAFCRQGIPEHVSLACLGDHGGIGQNPVPVHATATWYRLLGIAIDCAVLLGRADDARRWLGWQHEVRAAFGRWVDPTTGVVLVPGQSSQATALWHGLVPARARAPALATLLAEIAAAGDRFTTGMFATGDLLACLDAAGRNDLAYRLVASRQSPGYGFFVDQGATTLWEHWTRLPGWSRNHPLYAAVGAWLQRSLLGIRQAEGSVAWRQIVVAPAVVPGLAWAQGHHDTVRGRVASSWRRHGDGLVLAVEIPANAQAVVRVPMLGDARREVRESGVPIAQHGTALRADAGLSVRAIDADACEVHLGGGSYHFEVR
ncbi:MAG: family 78 glycoside hydrolase catalytic domain [Planctomycetes bacterium]|nr:family 78 glycoside hydrolase catalytic domain [Planctomycetota bacterium]